MIVIVLMGILASLVLINIGGIGQRQAMQAREAFLMDLETIAREANDQGLVLGLQLATANQSSALTYQVVQYPAQAQQSSNTVQWPAYDSFRARQLPEGLNVVIDVITDSAMALPAEAPKLIWLGNGEAQPVRMQFYWQEQLLGAEIQLDQLGKIHAQ